MCYLPNERGFKGSSKDFIHQSLYRSWGVLLPQKKVVKTFVESLLWLQREPRKV